MASQRLSKEESRRRFSELRELWLEWDPIGVTALPDWPRDEYDAYVGRSMRFLEDDAPSSEISKYLTYIVGEYMGLGRLGVEHSNPSAFAETMIEWFRRDWPNTYV